MTGLQVEEPGEMNTQSPRIVHRTNINDRWLLVVIALIGGILLFPRLGDIYLWMDEGETAMLGKNILKYGYPRMYDGRNLMTYYPPLHNEDYVEIVLPWLQYYAAAASFAVLGQNTATARLPFVLCGLATLLLFPAVIRRLTSDRWTQTAAPLVLATSVPFLLYIRQARYYGLVMLSTMWLIWAYLTLAEGRRRSAVHLTLAAVALFHSHYVVCAGTLFGIGLHWFFVYRSRIHWRTIVYMGLGFAALTLPWVLYAQFWTHGYGWFSIQKVGLFTGLLTARLFEDFVPPLLVLFFAALLIRNRYWRYMGIVGALCASGAILNIPGTPYMLTLCLGAGLLYWIIRKKEIETPVMSSLVWMLPAGVILVLSFLSPFAEARYLVGIVPFVYIACVFAFSRLRARFPRVAMVFFILFLSTNIFKALPAISMQLLPMTAYDFGVILAESDRAAQSGISRLLPEERVWFHKMVVIDEEVRHRSILQSYMWAYIYELTQGYDGPLEGIVAYLKQHGAPEDSVKMDYGAVPLMFYTNMRIIPEHLMADTTVQADWVILHRADWLRMPDAYFAYLDRSYERIVLPYPDMVWDNRPELRYHYFRPPDDLPQMVIYRRLKGKERAAGPSVVGRVP